MKREGLGVASTIWTTGKLKRKSPRGLSLGRGRSPESGVRSFRRDREAGPGRGGTGREKEGTGGYRRDSELRFFWVWKKEEEEGGFHEGVGVF